MKTFGLIFSFYLLFLATVMPHVSHAGAKAKYTHSQKKCCHSSCKDCPAERGNKNCPKGSCTPMFMCPNIHLAIHLTDEIVPAPFVSDPKLYSYYRESYYFTLLFAAWHPPRV
jgi:hypothetical protein